MQLRHYSEFHADQHIPFGYWIVMWEMPVSFGLKERSLDMNSLDFFLSLCDTLYTRLISNNVDSINI